MKSTQQTDTPIARSHTLALGDFELIALSDGGVNYPAPMILGNVPPREAENRGLPTKQLFVPYTILLIRTGEQNILVDVGAGDFGNEGDVHFPGLDHSTSRTNLVLSSLEAAGVGRDEIDAVIITHAHVDHVGDCSEQTDSSCFAVPVTTSVAKSETSGCHPILPQQRRRRSESIFRC